MTTLAANALRKTGQGNRSHFPVIAAEIIFMGAAVGLVAASGHARPLVGGDVFRGFATAKLDNSDGSAADLNVEVLDRGTIELSVSGAVITDVGQPVYATDDDTFVFSPVGGSFVGLVSRFVSSGLVEVEFDVDSIVDPWGYGPVEAITGAKTLDVEDTGKIFFVTATAVVTMAATAVGGEVTLVCGGPYGTVQISADPVAADLISAPDIAGTDNKDLINTLATANRGDHVRLQLGAAAGPMATSISGTWAEEA